jgi:hypothetical protein
LAATRASARGLNDLQECKIDAAQQEDRNQAPSLE